MQYQTHWRLAFVLAFFFHIIAWLFLTILIPHVFKALEAPPQEEPMEWVELADDPGPPEEEQQEEEKEGPHSPAMARLRRRPGSDDRGVVAALPGLYSGVESWRMA